MSTAALFDLTGRVAVVTGGSRGLGLRIAESLGGLGAAVALVARKPAELEIAMASLAARSIDVAAFPADLADEATILPLVGRILARYSRIDILVNNAGTAWAEPAEQHSLAGWRRVMALNIDAAFLLSQEIGRCEMIPRGAGKILNVASIGGLLGNRPEQKAYTLAYNTSKGALVNFTRALAAEWGRYGIHVNALCPGFFRSRLADKLIDRLETQLIAATPLGRLAEDEDFMGAAAFLCSDASRHVTGQMLVVDGGMSAC